MIRFGISEYIRNFWYNLCIILIMLVMMVTSTALISNIDRETGLYRLADRCVDEDSIFITYGFDELKEELHSIDGAVRVAEIIDGCYDPVKESSIRATVYTEETMNYLLPRLDAGVYPNRVKTDENTVCALISQNPYGIEVGDTFTYYVIGSEIGTYIPVQVYVSGIISEGQPLYIEPGEVFCDMTYEDFFQVYSYEQTQEVRLIIPEGEMEKIPEVCEVSFYSNIIIDPNDELSEEAQDILWEKAVAYQEEICGTGSMATYPEASGLIDRSEIKHKSTLLKYVPLFVIIVVLFSICIVGIITIKTVMSTRYYGIMYACGMQYHTAQFLAGLEMGFNCIVAFLGTVSLLTLQNALAIVGEINCNLDTLELLVMAGICIVTVISSVFTTRSVLKQQTPVEILKNRV